MTDVKKGDRVKVSFEGTAVHVYGEEELTIRLDAGGSIFVETDRSFDALNVEILEPPKPTNEELFEAIPVGGKFIEADPGATPEGYKDYITYVKISTNGYVPLSPWRLHDGYFEGGQGLIILSPSDFDNRFVLIEV